VTLTLTLDPAIRHTVVHHSSTSTYIPNFIEIEETFCGRTDWRTDRRTDGHFPPSLISLGRLLEVDLMITTLVSYWERKGGTVVVRCIHAIMVGGRITAAVYPATYWVNEWVGFNVPINTYRSFRRRVFPVNQLYWYWQPNKNNQETEHTKKHKKNNTTRKEALVNSKTHILKRNLG